MPSTVGRITRYALSAATSLNEAYLYGGDTISSVYLLLYSGGKFLPDDAQVEFSGVEGWEYLPGVSTLERPVIWTLSDFNAVINSGINWQHHKPLYRRVYHKEGDRTLAALKGVLHYSPPTRPRPAASLCRQKQ